MDAVKMQEKEYTLEDILNLPEGVHKEMLDGVVYDMAAPSTQHQRIAFNLARKVADHIDHKGGSCEVFTAPFGVFLTKDEKNYVEPDISVICDKDKISERGCEGAPDWIVEVVSPSTKSMDYLRKLYHYKQKGVRLYWIVDPASEMVSVYDFMTDTMEQYGFKDTVPVAIYEDLEIDMSKL
ncbi:MAG: Uma2 family endonuclease [Lachnospiraceae bacterium]|nr:Uma2 family endonuclease [Lachnospiraceae bacterium]